MISIHVPCTGGRLGLLYEYEGQKNFNPRPPCGGRLATAFAYCLVCFISIHVPRAGDDKCLTAIIAPIDISIHVPRAGDDFGFVKCFRKIISISIHVPRAGDDFCQLRLHVCLFSIKRKLAG